MVAVGLARGQVGCSELALAVEAPAVAEVAEVIEEALLRKEVVKGEPEAAEMERVEEAWVEASAETVADASSLTKFRHRLVF